MTLSLHCPLHTHLRRSSAAPHLSVVPQNNFMFITSQPYHQKRNFKFSNKLAGKFYNNNRFLSSCSYLESDFKLSTAGSEDQSIKLFPMHSQFNTNDEVSLRATGLASRKDSRHLEMRSAADKFRKTANHSSVQPAFRRNSVATDRKPQKVPKKAIAPQIQTRRTSLLDTALTMVKQVIAKKAPRRRNLKRKLAFNPDVDSFYSPFVEVRIIDKLRDLKEIEQKSIKVDFEKIYKKLIKTQLMGEFTANFMETVERYVREIVEQEQILTHDELDSSLKHISRKEQFLDKLVQLWGNNETAKIQSLVKYYCIPSKQTSDKILTELINDLIIDIYEKKSCNRDIDYVLLTENGQEIVHISQIYFSTQELLLSPKETLEKNYLHYRYLIDQHDRSLKMTMKQSIKHDFVEKIVFKEIDEGRGNYQDDPQEYNEYRREAIEQATAQIRSKSRLRLQAKKERDGESGLPFDNLLQYRNSSRNDNLFTNYILRKQREKRQYTDILHRLRKILDPSHKYIIRSKLDQSTEQQFRKLHLFNDQYDITYNHNKQNSHKMFLINMIQNCEIFNRKTTEQLERILSMLENAYGMGDLNLNEIYYWQFKEIYETAHGVAHSEVIMKFVLNYFAFDEFGEMKREDFFSALDVCLSQSGRPKRMIKDIIWSLLETMGLVVNGNLNRRNLSIWYEPIKVVYLLFLSIIFGGQYESTEQMVNDLIKFYE